MPVESQDREPLQSSPGPSFLRSFVAFVLSTTGITALMVMVQAVY